MKDKLKEILTNALTQILIEIGMEGVESIENPQKDLTCEIILTIGITGHLTGTMMLESNQKSATKIAEKMLSKINHFPEGDDFTESHQEAIREIMNLISGRSLMILSEQHIDCNLTPPTLITGKDIRPAMYNLGYSVFTGVRGSFGEIYFFFGVVEESITGST